MKRFEEIMNQPKPNNNIIKIYRILKNIIKNYYHDYWKYNLLGLEPTKESASKVEIDDSKGLGNSEKSFMNVLLN